MVGHIASPNEFKVAVIFYFTTDEFHQAPEHLISYCTLFLSPYSLLVFKMKDAVNPVQAACTYSTPESL